MSVRRFLALMVGLVAALGLAAGPAVAAPYAPSTGAGTVSDSSPRRRGPLRVRR